MTTGSDERGRAAYEFIQRCVQKPAIRAVAAEFAACVAETGRPDLFLPFVASDCEKPEFRRYHSEIRRCLDETDRLHRQRSQETVCESYIGTGPNAICVNPHPREIYWGRPELEDLEGCEAAVTATHLAPSPAPGSGGAAVSRNQQPAPPAAPQAGSGTSATSAGTATAPTTRH
jgi:hypothetical protein